ncbi:hypothetical protein [Pseudonocardia sp.]|jgi:hypothetical protein|uniref:hypothetical protein n=1 Tax=Pseudonocardia sp. TaxID=60912 RepID=UPI0031FC6D36
MPPQRPAPEPVSRAAFPFDCHTLARTGLVGAARALWVRDGTRSERIGRALHVAHDETSTDSNASPAKTPTRSSPGQGIAQLDQRNAEIRAAAVKAEIPADFVRP